MLCAEMIMCFSEFVSSQTVLNEIDIVLKVDLGSGLARMWSLLVLHSSDLFSTFNSQH